MSLSFKLDIDADEWDEYVSEHTHGHHEQTSGFAKLREEYGFTASRVGVYENDQLVGGSQLLIQNAPLIGRTAYVSQGPLVENRREDIMMTLLEGLDDVVLSLGVKRMRVTNYADSKFWSKALSDSGFVASGYRWGPGNTSLVSLADDNETILAGMKSKCRYNLRLAQRKGVHSASGDLKDVAAFHQLNQITASRQKFPTFPVEYFEYVWKLFAPQNKSRLFFAYLDETPLAGVFVTIVGNTAYYGWGGLSDQHTKLMGNYLAHWEAMQWARDIGCDYYDLGNVGGDDGVSRFKRQWGGDIVKYPDTYDKYYGSLSGLRQKGFELSWDSPQIKRQVMRVRYRTYKPMPY